MGSWWSNIFGAKRKKLLSFLEVDIQDIQAHPSGIQNIQGDNITGMVIRNALSADECRIIRDYFDNLPQEEIYETTSGAFTAPPPFSIIARKGASETQIGQYFMNCQQFWKDFTSVSGFDFLQKTKTILGHLGQGKTIETPEGPNGNGTFTPASIRKLVPGLGELNLHCGNILHEEHPEFFKLLSEKSHLHNQLSYFFMLQPAQKAGELLVYNMPWDTVSKRLPGGLRFETTDGTILDSSDEKQVARHAVKMNMGDLLIFGGGRYWHRVSQPEGDATRYTIGGFITPSTSSESMHIWS